MESKTILQWLSEYVLNVNEQDFCKLTDKIKNLYDSMCYLQIGCTFESCGKCRFYRAKTIRMSKEEFLKLIE